MVLLPTENGGGYMEGHTNVTISEFTKGSIPFVHEIQEILTSGTSGSFHLIYKDERTTSLSHDASSQEVKDALMQISSVDEVEVNKEIIGSQKSWKVTFIANNSNPRNKGNLPLIKVLKECADNKPCQMRDSDVSVSEIVNGTSPIFGNFSLTFERVDTTGAVTAQTTPFISVDATKSELQEAIRAVSFGSNCIVTSVQPISNQLSIYGSVWSFSLMDDGRTKISLNDENVVGPADLIDLCDDPICSTVCTDSSANVFGSDVFPTLSTLCASADAEAAADAALKTWCDANLHDSVTSTSCTTPSWAGCAYCSASKMEAGTYADDANFGVRLLSSRNVLQMTGNLQAVNNAISSIVYNPKSNWHSTTNGYDEVLLSVSGSDLSGIGAVSSTRFHVFVSGVHDPPGESSFQIFFILQ